MRTEKQKKERLQRDKAKREAGYYVYLLLNEEGQPHYVGMGRGERARISKHRPPLADGTPAPSYILLKEHLTKKEAQLLEAEFILFHWGTVVNERKPGKDVGNESWRKKTRWQVYDTIYYTLREAAEALDVSYGSLRKAFNKGRAPYVRKLNVAE